MTSIKHVLVAGPYNVPWREETWVRALQEIGAQVSEFRYNRILGAGVLSPLQKSLMWGPAVSRLNKELIDAVEDARPDVVLIVQGISVWPSTIEALGRMTWTTSYCNDDPFGASITPRKARHLIASIPLYGGHHVYREVNRQEFIARGGKNVRILLPFYVPWLHCVPDSLSNADMGYDRDIVFVGRGEDDARAEGIRALIEAGFSVTTFGAKQTWQRVLGRALSRRLELPGSVVGAEYARVLRSSRICLAFYSSLNRDQYTRRYFEIPACGGFMLGQGSPVVRKWYQEGEEAEFFDSTEELLDKTRHYLADDKRRIEIALAGHRRCVADGHDVLSRVRQWMRDVEQAMTSV